MSSNKLSILFLGKEHNSSASAQAYLEILQIRTANNSSNAHFLFRNIASAGIYIPTTFTLSNGVKRAQLYKAGDLDNRPLRALKEALRTNQTGDETDYILARTGNRKPQGLTLDHLYWDYIVCFQNSVKDEVERLRTKVINQAIQNRMPLKKPNAKIILLPVRYTAGDYLQNAKDLIAALEVFLAKSYRYDNGAAWKIPEKSMTGGKWRTRQIEIPEAQFDALNKGGSRSRWLKILERRTCYLNITSARNGRRLLSVTGSKSNVAAVVEEVEKFWA